MRLEKKVCLITGGTRGIGAASAIALAEQGADISLVARRVDDHARGVRRQIEQLGRKCALIGADVADPKQAVRCVEETVSQLGPVDVLIHSAGGPVIGSLLEVTPEQWMKAFDIHVHAIYHLSRAVIPMMQKKKEGVILLVSSAA